MWLPTLEGASMQLFKHWYPPARCLPTLEGASIHVQYYVNVILTKKYTLDHCMVIF